MNLNDLDTYLDFSRVVFPKLEFQSQEIREGWVIEAINSRFNLESEYWGEEGMNDDLDTAVVFCSFAETLGAVNGLKDIYKHREFRPVKVVEVFDSRLS